MAITHAAVVLKDQILLKVKRLKVRTLILYAAAYNKARKAAKWRTGQH